MTESLVMTIVQFGPAGLIGLLWILERRHAANRDRQLDEAHRSILSREREVDALLSVVKENTRAINALEASQARLNALLERMASSPRTRRVSA